MKYFYEEIVCVFFERFSAQAILIDFASQYDVLQKYDWWNCTYSSGLFYDCVIDFALFPPEPENPSVFHLTALSPCFNI